MLITCLRYALCIVCGSHALLSHNIVRAPLIQMHAVNGQGSFGSSTLEIELLDTSN